MVTPIVVLMYCLPVERGVYVTGVADGSYPGFLVDDIITRVGEVELDEAYSYLNLLFEHQPGD